MGTKSPPRTLDQLLNWLASAPDGTTVSADAMHRLLADVASRESTPEPGPLPAPAGEPSWRERIWTAPGETRLTLPEVAEALGKSKSWCYKRTGPKAETRIPHRKLDGELVFVVGEIRVWLREHEEIIEAGPSDRPRLHAS